jgi:hypothetical protein
MTNLQVTGIFFGLNAFFRYEDLSLCLMRQVACFHYSTTVGALYLLRANSTVLQSTNKAPCFGEELRICWLGNRQCRVYRDKEHAI